MDLHQAILDAKLGRTRKDAQIDTCAVFASALYDVLQERGIPCKLVTAAYKASPESMPSWYHEVLEHDGRLYDSMGEFSADIYRTRAKIHPKVSFVMEYKPSGREDNFEEEFEEMHAFYVKMLSKAVDAHLTADPEEEAGPQFRR
jgi:hypothetical protein